MTLFWLFFSLRLLIVLAVFQFGRIAGLLIYPWYWDDQDLVSILQSMLIGIRFDLPIAAFLFFPFDLVWLLLGKWSKNKIIYYTIAVITGFSLVFSIYVICISLFTFKLFQRHITIELQEFIAQFHTVFNEAVTAEAFVFFPGIALLIAVLCGWVMLWRKFYPIRFGAYRYNVIAAFMLLAVGVIVARGGVQEKPIVVGFAYSDGNAASAYLRLNSVFTLIHYYAGSQMKPISLVAPDLAEKNTAKLTDTSNRKAVKGYPFLKAYTEKTGTPTVPFKPDTYNVVILVMESANAEMTGTLTPVDELREFLRDRAPQEKRATLFDGLSPDHPLFTSLTPEFDRLAAAGVLFDNFYASGSNSAQGLFAIQTSMPILSGVDITDSGFIQSNFMTLNGMLKSQGYTGMYITGLFDGSGNNDRLMKRGGIDRIVQKSAFENADSISDSWGVYDGYSLQRMSQELASMPEPFFAHFVSVTAHTPLDLPPDTPFPVPDDIPLADFLNELHYVDKVLGDFMRKEATQPYFARTVYIILADHTNYIPGEDRYAYGHIPLLFYAPAILPAKRISSFANQVDLTATLADLTGYTDELVTGGVSMLTEHEPFMLNYSGESFRWFFRGLGLDISRDLQRIKAYRLKDGTEVSADDPNVVTAKEFFQSYYQSANNALVLNHFRP